MQSIGRPAGSTALAVSRDVVFFVPGLLLLSAAGGVTAMLWAAPIADVLAAALTAVLLRREMRNLRRRAAAEQ